MKRQRGRGRKPGGGGGHHHNNQGGHMHPNRTLESNGPDTKVRGPAAHIYERYLQLARDAASSGDRVLSENYLQHADHYFRLVRSMQPAVPVHQPQQNFGEGGDFDGEEDGAADAEGEDTEARSGEEQSESEYTAQDDRPQREDRGDGEGRRRGRNRRRFRPEGEREGGFEAREGEGGGEPRETREPREAREPREPREAREQREPRDPRRERQPREDRDGGTREGFSDGPKPAFLRGGGGGE